MNEAGAKALDVTIIKPYQGTFRKLIKFRVKSSALTERTHYYLGVCRRTLNEPCLSFVEDTQRTVYKVDFAWRKIDSLKLAGT
jgi:hypothetical protein